MSRSVRKQRHFNRRHTALFLRHEHCIDVKTTLCAYREVPRFSLFLRLVLLEERVLHKGALRQRYPTQGYKQLQIMLNTLSFRHSKV